ncbi:putative peptidoglycan lipid II flippase [Microbacterium endophyticum]|uniref:Putative peptidoglycan lipid II flippase n=1 Tax=Microbacterium endophyticum TaxID=1526412 RepID=A0A7W4V4S2_9MICO|nr:murein biosynthesis integral membrane protein MurJ [Microbacterium endophyticum]MBB2976519.1 putative peptidoglycan lipid II flippase [Microbacterium endophyticum]NIK35965.1 putative peptidoglycan lipid II flippase [Microbacterium endophyticum]
MSGIGRASLIIGAGTIASRLSGFVRSIVLVAAVGSISGAANAFGIANQLPNNVFAIISTGLLTAVLVPQIARSAHLADGGSAFVSKLLTVGTVTLLGATALALALAPQLVTFYQPDFSADQAALATTFAYWCLPQIFFYGMYALLGETLNARNIFGPFTWAPIVNNVVSIAGFGLFFLIFGTTGAVTGWTPAMIALLAGTSTLGIAVQAGMLLFFWRRAGLRVRPDFRWRGMGLGQIGRLAGWTFLMVVVGQLAAAVQSRQLPPEGSPGVAATQYAWLLFMLPYSIIVISIGTPYFTRLSKNASAGRHTDVRDDIGSSIRTVGVFIVIATVALSVGAVPASRIFATNSANALLVAPVLQCFLIGLVPLAVLFVIQRTFYAYDDTRTPFFFTLVQASLVVITALIAGATLGDADVAAGIALGQSFASIVQLIIATWLLHRRLGGIGFARWATALLRFAVAAVPAAAAGWAVLLLLGGPAGWPSATIFSGVATLALIGVVMLVVYGGALAVLRAPELTPALAIVRRFIPGAR